MTPPPSPRIKRIKSYGRYLTPENITPPPYTWGRGRKPWRTSCRWLLWHIDISITTTVLSWPLKPDLTTFIRTRLVLKFPKLVWEFLTKNWSTITGCRLTRPITRETRHFEIIFCNKITYATKSSKSSSIRHNPLQSVTICCNLSQSRIIPIFYFLTNFSLDHPEK